MSDLNQLIEDLSAASEGSRDLDARVAMALGWQDINRITAPGVASRAMHQDLGSPVNQNGKISQPPAYTPRRRGTLDEWEAKAMRVGKLSVPSMIRD